VNDYNKWVSGALYRVQGTDLSHALSYPPQKKLNKLFEPRAQAALAAQSALIRPAVGSGSKLTWSERRGQ